jgi:hypothetical protein
MGRDLGPMDYPLIEQQLQSIQLLSAQPGNIIGTFEAQEIHAGMTK